MIVTSPLPTATLGTSLASGLHLATPVTNQLRVFKDPFIPSMVTTTPVVSSVYAPRRYQDLNTDGELRSRMTSYYYSKLYEQWIYSDFRFMLKNLKVTGSQVVATKKSDKNASESDTNTKIYFLRNKVFTREIVYRLLVQYINRSRTNWYDLKMNKPYVKALFRHKLAKAIRKLF